MYALLCHLVLISAQVGQWLKVELGFSYEQATEYGAALCAQGLHTREDVFALGVVELENALTDKVHAAFDGFGLDGAILRSESSDVFHVRMQTFWCGHH